MAAQRKERSTAPLKNVIANHLFSVVPATVLTCVLASAVIIMVAVMPLSMQEAYHASTLSSFGLTSVIIVSLNIGCVIAGFYTDRFGAWAMALIYSALFPVGVGILSLGLFTGGAWLMLACVVGGLCCGIVGVVPSIMTALFPTEVRVSGIALTYNTAYSIWAGITTPISGCFDDQNVWACASVLVIGLAGGVTVAVCHRRHMRAASLIPGRDRLDLLRKAERFLS